MKMRNFVKEKIAENGYALGAFVASGSPMNCEIPGLNGLDFVMIDCEHAETNPETIVHMCRACEENGAIAGIVTASAEDAVRRIRQGVQFVTCMNDLGFFRSRCARG